MNLTGKKRVYKGQYGYSIIDRTIEKEDGTKESIFVNINFPKAMKSLPNHKDYCELEGFTSPYKDKEGKVQVSYMITKWQKAEEPKQGQAKSDPYADFAKEATIEVTDSNLPF